MGYGSLCNRTRLARSGVCNLHDLVRILSDHVQQCHCANDWWSDQRNTHNLYWVGGYKEQKGTMEGCFLTVVFAMFIKSKLLW